MRHAHIHTLLVVSCSLIIAICSWAQSAPAAKHRRPSSAPSVTDTAATLEIIRNDVQTLKERKTQIYDAEVLAPLLSTVIIAALGWFFTWRVTKYSIGRSGTIATEERLFETLKLFTEGTQARSLAISSIEAYWDRLPWFQPAWAAALANQAIHLLTRTKERTSRVEQDNAMRILDLLARRYDPKGKPENLSPEAPLAFHALSVSQRRSLKEAILASMAPDSHKRGVKIPRFTSEWWLYINGVSRNDWQSYFSGTKQFGDLGPK